ncbi:hypothetical protein B296_00056211 [Ensete ventricosum]|uniref:Uncharacterized protein n=1 Tax=Ensete ventricosum TaxID=4639 RepID=A0A426XI18_ENSVE|nr:hypothetical protein B296_00056211 [Ensete ventricosum]
MPHSRARRRGITSVASAFASLMSIATDAAIDASQAGDYRTRRYQPGCDKKDEEEEGEEARKKKEREKKETSVPGEPRDGIADEENLVKR